jgi:hypothetical protein
MTPRAGHCHLPEVDREKKGELPLNYYRKSSIHRFDYEQIMFLKSHFYKMF